MRLKLGIRNKLLLPITFIMIAGMLISAIISYNYTRTAIRSAVGENMLATVDSSRKQMAAWLLDLESDLHTFSLNPLFEQVLDDPSLHPKLNKMLQQIKQVAPQYENLGMLDHTGLIIAGSNPAVVGKLRLNERDYFKGAMNGNSVISQPVISRDTGNPIFVVSVPLKKNGTIQGVIFAAVDLSGFSKAFIDPIKIGEKGYAFVTDKGGMLIAHPDKKRILKVNTRDYAIGKKMADKTSANKIVSYILDGEKKILVFAVDKVTGWTIGVTASPEDIYSAVLKIRNVNAIMTIILVAVIGLVLFILVTPIVNALKKGVAFADAVRSGDTSMRLGMQRSDELGQLSSALDAMADGLQARAERVEQVADGDLSVNISLQSDHDTLGHALVKMIKNLNQSLAEVNMVGEQVASGSTQISGAAQSLSQGGSESAASLEEITASVTQMASQSEANAENALQAKKLSSSAQTFADQGNSRMKDMVQAMTKIQGSSQNISKIIKTIDEIAFQTNLLALNAAVEAARAGQHGKGFAVVAEEVRNLAARSAKAAKETAELIEGSVTLTANGADIANQTATELEKIVNEVHKVTDLVTEIAAVSEEQAQGIKQVNVGLGQIDSVTQQNMAMAEESAASAEQLASQADRLQAMLRQFRLTAIEEHNSTRLSGGPSAKSMQKSIALS